MTPFPLPAAGLPPPAPAPALSPALREAAPQYQLIRTALLAGFLWRARGWILGIALAAAMLAAFWLWVLAIPLYRAEASVMMETAPPSGLEVTMFTSPFIGTPVEIVSQMEVLRSNELLLQLARAEELEDDPEFAPRPFWSLSPLWSLWPPGAAPAVDDQDQRDQALVEKLRERLFLRNIPGSLVFELAIASEDPHKSLRLSNALARAYIAHQVASRQQVARDAAAWLSLRSAELRETLILTELQAASQRAASSFRSPEALTLLEQQIKDLRDRLARTGPGTSPESEAAMRSSLARLEASHARQSRDYIALQQLEREVEAQRELYQHFLSQLQQNLARAGLQSAGSMILSLAILPARPFTPRYKLVLGLALLGGGLCGAAIAWMRLASMRGLRTPEEAEQFSGLPVLGMLPLLPGLADGADRVGIGTDPASLETAMIRNLRAGIELALPPEAQAPVILCSSALPGEGKTTTIRALAAHLAGLGQRVLVLDADAWGRQPPATAPLRLRPGDALALDQALMQLCRHQAPRSPFRLEASAIAGLRREDWSPAVFGLVIGFAQRHFDITLIDSPPLLLVRETLRMLPYCDFTLLLVEWQRSDRRHLAESLALLARGRSANGTAIGLVLNKIDRDAIARTGDAASFAPLFQDRGAAHSP